MTGKLFVCLTGIHPQVTVFSLPNDLFTVRSTAHMPNCMHGSPKAEVSRFRAQIVREADRKEAEIDGCVHRNDYLRRAVDFRRQ